MLSSQDHDLDIDDEARHGRYWIDVGTGGWDSAGRASEVRLRPTARARPGDDPAGGLGAGRGDLPGVLAAAGEYHALEEA